MGRSEVRWASAAWQAVAARDGAVKPALPIASTLSCRTTASGCGMQPHSPCSAKSASPFQGLRSLPAAAQLSARMASCWWQVEQPPSCLSGACQQGSCCTLCTCL